MPQILVAAAGALSLCYACRWVQLEFDRVDASLRRTQRRIRRQAAASVAELTLDGENGIYRLAD